MPSDDVRVFCLEASGLATAAAAARLLGGQLVLRSGLESTDPHLSSPDFSEAVRDAFAAGVPVVGVCSAGILVRILAPFIRDKHAEPCVVCIAEDGSSVIPLIGGHAGGNDLARSIAAGLSAHAAITTAGDLGLGVALDNPPAGWRLENPGNAKRVTAAILAGEQVMISGGKGWLEPMRRLPSAEFSDAPDANAPIIVQAGAAGCLIYRETNLALGVGSSRNCPPEELIGLVRSTLADHGHSPFAIEAVYSVDIKSDEAAIHALARDLGIEVRFFAPERLEIETPRLGAPSATVFREIGCHGVSEAAALAAAGRQAELQPGKQKSANATCAIARIGNPRGERGKRRGKLALVGIGPGHSQFRSREATGLLAGADELIGYTGYIDLVRSHTAGKQVHGFALGEEERRCRFALERAGAGSSVALICSGDSGIYAMGALVMELLGRGDAPGGVSAAARRAEIVSTPGITAMQAASAGAGAMLGHDFCAISLSDLLTPRDAIIRRITAAADGDFVIAFYNPVSAKRRKLIEVARDILLRARPAATPVLIARNVGRGNDELTVCRLDQLSAEGIDMMTVVLVGSSASRAFATGDSLAGAQGWRVYTPRGYGLQEGLSG